MGIAPFEELELIRITMIDYFSGATLIDNLVEPDIKLLHLNTKYSGVTEKDMKNAIKQGTILQGKAGARQAIWKYVGPNTLVVGHGLQKDLKDLRWIHVPVVDSYVFEFPRVQAKQAIGLGLRKREEAKLKEEEARLKEEEEQRLKNDVEVLQDPKDMSTQKAVSSKTPKDKRPPGPLSLKFRAKRYLDRDIQNKDKEGHDSLENAMAAREVVHCNVLNLMACE